MAQMYYSLLLNVLILFVFFTVNKLYVQVIANGAIRSSWVEPITCWLAIKNSISI